MGVGHFKMIIKWSRGWFFSQVYRGWLFPKDLTKLPGNSALTMVLGLTIRLILSARRQYLHMQQSSSRHFVWQFFSRLQWNQVQMLWNDWGYELAVAVFISEISPWMNPFSANVFISMPSETPENSWSSHNFRGVVTEHWRKTN